MSEDLTNHNNISAIATMEQIMQEAISALDRSKVKMFDVASVIREEYMRVRTELEEIKRQVAEVVDQVDKTEKRYRVLRLRLMKVSSDFTKYSEQDVQKAYAEAQQCQTELAVLKEREEELKKNRTQTERRLIRVSNMVVQAEEMVSSLTSALEVLSGKLTGMAAKLEGYKTWNIMGNQIIQAQEEERRRIAREIHDGPAQAMANIVLRAEICEKIHQTGKGSLAEELAELKALVKGSLKEVRQIIFNLRPMTLDDLGLAPTLSQYIDEYRKDINFNVELVVCGQERRLPKSIEVAFFRLIQEALHNVKKHAEAKNVTVTLHFQKNQVKVVVTDDGKGFDPASVEKGKEHFGLLTMRERTELLSGTFEVKSSPGQGTTITALIPIAEDEEKSAI